MLKEIWIEKRYFLIKLIYRIKIMLLHDASREYKIDEKYVSSGLKIFKTDNYIAKESSHTF